MLRYRSLCLDSRQLRRAEAELARREEHVKQLHIRDLKPETRRHYYAEAWRREQALFADDSTAARQPNKLKYDSASRAYKPSKVMPEGMAFPYDFGCCGNRG